MEFLVSSLNKELFFKLFIEIFGVSYNELPSEPLENETGKYYANFIEDLALAQQRRTNKSLIKFSKWCYGTCRQWRVSRCLVSGRKIIIKYYFTTILQKWNILTIYKSFKYTYYFLLLIHREKLKNHLQNKTLLCLWF